METAPESRGLLGDLQRQLSGLPKRQSALARYILAKPEIAKSISLQKLCQACGTSEPVVFAFCRRFGFKGFRDFKTALAEDLGARRNQSLQQSTLEIVDAEYVQSAEPHQVLQKMGAAYLDSLNLICRHFDGRSFQRAVNLLDKAERIALIGVGVSGNVGFVALQNLIRTGTPISWTNDPNLNFTHLAPLKRNDVCLALSQLGNQKDTIEGAAFAKKRKIKVIAVTSDPESPLAELADVLLLTQAEPTSAATHLSIGAQIALPVLFMTDALAVALGARRKRAVQLRADLTHEAMKSRSTQPRRSRASRKKD